uniref:Transmembrane protein n=1 Tax=Oryza brachyantha TaxID=4533 RepID=J3MSH5_ORYBR
MQDAFRKNKSVKESESMTVNMLDLDVTRKCWMLDNINLIWLLLWCSDYLFLFHVLMGYFAS